MGVWALSALELFWITPPWTLTCRFLCDMFSFPLCVCLEVELIGPLVTLCLAFWRTARWISMTAVPVYILTGRGGVPASYPHRCLSLFVFLTLAILVCVRSGVRVGHDWATGLNWKASDAEYLVYCFVIGHVCMFFGETSVPFLCSFFNCVVCLFFCCCKLCTFWIQILHQTCDWQIFSPLGCHFTFLQVSSESQVLILMKSNLTFVASGVMSKNPLLNPRSQGIYTCVFF